MLDRIASIAAIAFTLALPGCAVTTEAPPEDIGEASAAAKGGKTGNEEAAKKDGAAPDSKDPTKIPTKPGGEDGAGGKPTKPEPSTPGDACFATCSGKLAYTCGYDKAACVEVCANVGEAQVACVAAKGSCDKAVWTNCAQSSGEPDPAKK